MTGTTELQAKVLQHPEVRDEMFPIPAPILRSPCCGDQISITFEEIRGEPETDRWGRTSRPLIGWGDPTGYTCDGCQLEWDLNGEVVQQW